MAVYCGCTLQRACCERGYWLMVKIAAGCKFIEAPSFLTLPRPERDAFWVDYHQTVREYLVHCGYLLGTERGELNASEH
jgi:hypothetical protein